MGERSRELFILVAGDVTVFATTLWLMLAVRYLEIPTVERLESHVGPFLLLSAIWLLVYYIAGLYDKHTVFLKNQLVSRIINTQIVNIFIAVLIFAIIPFDIAPKSNLIIYLFISVALISVWRLKIFNFFSPRHKYRAILIAGGEEALELIEEVNNNDRYNYTFVRLIDENVALDTTNFETKLMDIIENDSIQIIVANSNGEHIQHILPKLFDLAFLRFEFVFLDFHKVYEDTFDRVPLSSLRYDWFISNVSQNRSLFYDFFKRLIDIVGSLVIGCVLIILLPIIFISKKIEGKGEAVFMRQKRIGQFNQLVDIFKIQTMTVNDMSSSTWTSEDKQKGNEITRTGEVLRKMSIDELPQIWNILKGEMSLIGPRNDIEGLGNMLAKEIPYYNIRNFVKPGVSGWAQTHQYYMGDNISPQSLEETKLRLAYDLYYVKNRSFMLDLEIALRTIKTILSRFGIKINLDG